MRKIVGLVLGCALAACGGSSGGGGGGTCEQIGRAICSKACSCRDGAACSVSQGSGGVTLSTDLSNEANCLALYVTFTCMMGDKGAYNDAAACLPMIQAATCTGTGADGALAFPTDPACDSPP